MQKRMRLVEIHKGMLRLHAAKVHFTSKPNSRSVRKECQARQAPHQYCGTGMLPASARRIITTGEIPVTFFART